MPGRFIAHSLRQGVGQLAQLNRALVERLAEMRFGHRGAFARRRDRQRCLVLIQINLIHQSHHSPASSCKSSAHPRMSSAAQRAMCGTAS